jgi:restriction system protein
MRRHRRFEFLAGEYLKQEGYQTEVTQGSADWGVDVFAEKDGKRYVVQAKMYGYCKTKVTRSMMMELYGVMHYFDCQGAFLIYNGGIMPDALKVAEKLGIQMIYLDQHLLDQLLPEVDADSVEDIFSKVWDEVRQLEGHQIANARGTQYTVTQVTDGDITYINQKGNQLREKADLFRRIVAYICRYGSVEQCQLRGEFGTYASAFIATVFANLPSYQATPKPTTITVLNPTNNNEQPNQ